VGVVVELVVGTWGIKSLEINLKAKSLSLLKETELAGSVSNKDWGRPDRFLKPVLIYIEKWLFVGSETHRTPQNGGFRYRSTHPTFDDDVPFALK